MSYPVLYFLHGLGGNEQLLLNSGGMDLIQDLRDQKKIGEFLVVSPINGGRTFYIEFARWEGALRRFLGT